MELPRVRLTVRRLMVGVAVIGILSGGVALGRRYNLYQQRAREYGERESRRLLEIRRLKDHFRYGLDKTSPTYQLEMEILGWNAWSAVYFRKPRIIYEFLASRPWLAGQPDPLEPDYVWKVESGLR